MSELKYSKEQIIDACKEAGLGILECNSLITVLGCYQPEATAPAQDLSAAIPDGWKLVPVEPTEEMMDSCRGGFITALAMPAFVAAYKTMVEAAPQTLQTKGGLYVLDNLSTEADDEWKIITKEK